jgi:hypothetical protein
MVTVSLFVPRVAAAQGERADPNWKPEGPVPFAADGHPDLTGVWWRGADVAVVGLNVGSARSRQAPAPGSSFTSLYNPAAMAKAKALGDKDDPALRCIPSVNGNSGVFQLVQNPKFVVLLQETYHGFRVIPTDPGRQHRDDVPPSYKGDSIGHWEGDTLVVDVTNFNDKNWMNAEGNVSFHSDALHVIERYRRLAANALEVEKTYEDPKVLTGPWKTGKQILRLAPFDAVMEVLCTGVETQSLMDAASKNNYGRPAD